MTKLMAAIGSSPLARGLPTLKLSLKCSHRIIPARAGFTFTARIKPDHIPDHPRSRGVYARAMAPLVPRPGSSPLARGLRLKANSATQDARIIPARAGFTSDGDV